MTAKPQIGGKFYYTIVDNEIRLIPAHVNLQLQLGILDTILSFKSKI